MNFLASAVLSGILYDLIKSGVTNLSAGKVFGSMYYSNIDESKGQRFLDEINCREDISDKIEYTKNTLTTENEYTTMFERELYKTNFAKRLDYALSLINDTDYFSRKYNVESLGEFLGLQSVNELKKCYITDEEPTYEFMDMVANKLGINPRWMKSGQGNIFETQLRRLYRGTELFDEKDYGEIQEFIFAMHDDTNERQIVLIRKMNELKYEFYPKPFVFYYTRSGSGGSELYSVYKMLKKLNSENKMPLGVYLLDKEKYYALLRGEIYPGSIKKEETIGCLLDDFISIRDGRREKFEQWYGRTFVEAQEYIIERMKDDKE